MSSFGDCAAFSDEVDITVASLLKTEVSDTDCCTTLHSRSIREFETEKERKISNFRD
ncbi:hypothetical protein ACSS31_26795 [Priestia megaterium]